MPYFTVEIELKDDPLTTLITVEAFDENFATEQAVNQLPPHSVINQVTCYTAKEHCPLCELYPLKK